MNNLIFKKEKSIAFEKKLLKKLVDFNRLNNSFFEKNKISEIKFNVGVYDDKTGQFVGGISAKRMDSNWVHSELLYVDESYRGADIGTQLMKRLEAFAKEHGCVGIHLETWDFQARDFYVKLGYEVFAELPDNPPNSVMYYLKKVF